jgi:hypothetical protein
MPSKPGRRKRCGAKSRRNAGAPCKNWAVIGADRCRMHGGTHPKGGDAPQATQRLKHGLYAKAFSAEEKADFELVFADMLDDPTTAMMADAALMRVKAATAAGKADPSGMIAVRRSGSKRTEPALEDGKQQFYLTDDSVRKPLYRVTETVSEDRADVMPQISDLLMRAARLAELSVMLKKRAGIVGDDERGALTEESMADVMLREFNDAGGLQKKEPDGPAKPSGAGGARQGW